LGQRTIPLRAEALGNRKESRRIDFSYLSPTAKGGLELIVRMEHPFLHALFDGFGFRSIEFHGLSSIHVYRFDFGWPAEQF
jgi:hypothetical protein